MTGKVLIFTGAPENSTLDWENGGLLSHFQDSIARFAGIGTNDHQPEPALSLPDHALWRLLPIDKTKESRPCSPKRVADARQYGYNDYPPDTAPEFFTTASFSFASDNGDGGGDTGPSLSQFYEQSIVAHEDVTSSHLVFQSTEQTTSFTSDATTSFVSGCGSQSGPIKAPIVFRGSDNLCNLKNIPSPNHIAGIQPQTMTINIIVGLISIPLPRAVKTRWGTRYLVEILVGDETKAGFSITYWLPSDNLDESPLAGLRPRDIVLFQNVGLNVFAKKVYGHSLRKGLTRMYLLYRTKLDSRDVGGHYSTSDLSTSGVHQQLDKTRLVRDWILNFVGRGATSGSNKPDTGPRWNRPPADDTQLT
ncbi:uncharacterized protein C8A04DRAFT_34258 [Dichotomopilus funicola]|uniref:Nucleic acid-binding, OB-fold protein n=1 Tax=Dichotomopilus funicola TaxID=1934379 RepID=A0AAN6ZSK8_9PEZI|nr:hypothetical protein C8A04DRAFT_34258 [Dichotomopilus funicola]